jgi:hypothetical protein
MINSHSAARDFMQAVTLPASQPATHTGDQHQSCASGQMIDLSVNQQNELPTNQHVDMSASMQSDMLTGRLAHTLTDWQCSPLVGHSVDRLNGMFNG